MIAIIMSGLFVCVLLGKYWSRVTWQGGLATLAGGAVCSLLIISIPSWNAYWGNPSIPAVAAAFISGVLVSLITPESKVTNHEAAEILQRERAIMEMGEGG
jgi:SSS family solute:Na+ symporter